MRTLPPSDRPPLDPDPRLPPEAYTADFLFRGRQEVLITHNGDIYRLRITRNGKLILTK
jgi:hemin uptake protein HemP